MERILILGGSGLVGKALWEKLDKKYDVYGTYSSNKIVSPNSICFNVSEFHEIKHILDKVKPSRIIYCLRGDFDAQIKLINELAVYLRSNSGKLYFCSTGNVFDGDTTAPHFKHQEPIAESDYGKFKIECEKIISKELNENGVILRLPMIWGKDSPRLNSIVNALKNNENIEVYTNLYFNNNTDEMLATQIGYILENDLKGIFHLGSREVADYYEFIKKVIENLGYSNASFNEETLPGEKYYLAVLPTEGELPEQFSFSNDYVIDDITANRRNRLG